MYHGGTIIICLPSLFSKLAWSVFASEGLTAKSEWRSAAAECQEMALRELFLSNSNLKQYEAFLSR